MQWEYKVVNLSGEVKKSRFHGHLNQDDLEKKLNHLGGQGWELLSGILPRTAGMFAAQGEQLCIFKRPK